MCIDDDLGALVTMERYYKSLDLLYNRAYCANVALGAESLPEWLRPFRVSSCSGPVIVSVGGVPVASFAHFDVRSSEGACKLLGSIEDAVWSLVLGGYVVPCV